LVLSKTISLSRVFILTTASKLFMRKRTKVLKIPTFIKILIIMAIILRRMKIIISIYNVAGNHHIHAVD
jgi:hypothetical protein